MVIQFIISTLQPSLALYATLSEYEEITNVILRYFNSVSLLVYILRFH